MKRFIRNFVCATLVGGLILVSVVTSFAQEMPSPAQYDTLREYEISTGEEITSFKEAPVLAKLVEDGEIPPLSERLPEEPMVVVPVERPGKYGGRIVSADTLTNMAVEAGWSIGEGMLQLDADNVEVLPNIAKAYEFSEDKKVFTLYLRKGLKWSDGHPATADDVMFWWEDITLNEELTPVLWTGWQPGGETMKVEKVDEYTVRFYFAQPYLNFVYRLLGEIMVPKHYLKNFHPEYTSQEELDRLTKEGGYDYWWQLFAAQNDYLNNPDLPTLNAWKLVKLTPEAGFFERNPYYWKIDTEGNQLPYIDERLVYRAVDREVANIRIVNGELDCACAAAKLEDYPLYMENREKGGYRVMMWKLLFQSATGFMFNLTYDDLVLRDIFQDVRFRRAMSLAINREEINEAAFYGLGVPMQSGMPPGSRFYDPEFAQAYAEYNPEEANRLLDEMGLTERDKDGYRLRPDGETLFILFECTDIGAARGLSIIWPLVQKYWRDIGVKTEIRLHERGLFDTRLAANMVAATMWGITGVEDAELLTTCSWLVIGPQNWWNCSWWGIKWYDWFATGGKKGEEPPAEIKRLLSLYEKIQVASTPQEQDALVREILASQAENLWVIGTVANIPQPIIVSNRLRNFPDGCVWGVYSHGYMPANPCQWFVEE